MSSPPFSWELLQHCCIYNRALRNIFPRPTCGKILAHAKRQIVSFREQLGVGVSVFEIGVTACPPQRFRDYWAKNFTMMWILYMGDDAGLVHMLEAALIAEFQRLPGCRNAENSGGEGALNRKACPEPPFFVYVTGGRADQPRRVG